MPGETCMTVRPFAASAILGLVFASTATVPGATPQDAGRAGTETNAPGSDTFRGEALFFQRCALCHLNTGKSGPLPPIGPRLNGVLKDPSPEREAKIRDRIRTGSQGMPGFRYGLDPKQLDQLVAYLRTLK